MEILIAVSIIVALVFVGARRSKVTAIQPRAMSRDYVGDWIDGIQNATANAHANADRKFAQWRAETEAQEAEQRKVEREIRKTLQLARERVTQEVNRINASAWREFDAGNISRKTRIQKMGSASLAASDLLRDGRASLVLRHGESAVRNAEHALS